MITASDVREMSFFGLGEFPPTRIGFFRGMDSKFDELVVFAFMSLLFRISACTRSHLGVIQSRSDMQ
jgi:hypothetical protein